jgi:flagellar capping protein FliD
MKLYLFIMCLGCSWISHTHAQAASEAAATSSVAGASASEAKSVPLPATSSAGQVNGSAHLNAGAGASTATLNRRTLERQAGRDAGKLLLRSDPSGAQAWIDGLFIGKTPVLLLLAPGKHRMEIHGPRQKFASGVLELLPRETRDVAMNLTVRYPTNVIVR